MLLICSFIIVVLWYYIVFCNSRLYCFIFEHKEWKVWQNCYREIDSFKCEHVSSIAIRFYSEKLQLDVIIWKATGLCSIHNSEECLASTFDEYHSKKMTLLLMRCIPCMTDITQQ